MSNLHKFTMLSLATSSILLGSQTFNIKSGWNLIGFVEQGDLTVKSFIEKAPQDSIEKLVTQVDGSFKIYDPKKSYLQKFKEFKGGQGYWIKANQDFNLTTNGSEKIDFPTKLNAGWNLIATSIDDSVKDKIKTLALNGIKVEKFVTQINGSFKIYDPSKSYLQKFKNFDSNLGYWIKVQKKLATISTSDNYSVELYVNKEDVNLSSVITALSNKTISEIGQLSADNFIGVSNIVVTNTENAMLMTSTYLEPQDSNFQTSLESEVSNSLNYTKVQDSFDTAGTSLYIYEIASGGSPKIISGVNVYSLVDGKKDSMIGTTSETGFLYLPSVSTNPNIPTQILVEKNGYESSVQNLNAIQGGANYIFISEDTGSSFSGSDSQINSRILGRDLFASSDGFWKSSSQGRQKGLIYYPINTKLNNSSVSIRVKNSSMKTFPKKDQIEKILSEKNYLVNNLGGFKIYATKDGSKSYNLPFNELTNQDNSNFKYILGINLPESLDEVIGEQGKSAVEDLIELYTYKNGDWEKLGGDLNISSKIEIYQSHETLPSSFSSGFQSGIKSFFNGGSSSTAVLVIDGDLILGPSPVFAIYKKQTGVDEMQFNTYKVNVKVLSADNQVLNNSMVTLARGNGNTEVSKSVNAEGIASFDILSITGSLEDFSLSILEGNHYPLTQNMNLSNLNQIENNVSQTDITINLKNPPQYATVKGEVVDADNESLENSKVKLFYPIAMADVTGDVTKVIDSKKVMGVEVASIPNARYSWFIKVHNDSQIARTSSRVLNRISSERWTLVQRSSAKDNGNFLPYKKIVGQALAPRKNGDVNDLKIIASGKFDVALQVEHDIDGDGKRDFTELSASDTAYANSDNKHFVANPDSNYSVELGYLSTFIDVDRLYKDSSQKQGTKGYDYVSVDGGTFKPLYSESDGIITLSEDEDDVSTNNSDIVELSSISNYDERVEDGELSDTFTDNINNLINIDDSHILDNGRLGGYLKVTDKTEGNHINSSVEWSIIIHSAIKDDNGNLVYFSLRKNANGSFSWIQENNGQYDAKDDYSKAIVVKASASSKNLYMKNLSKIISSNQVLQRLAQPIGDVFKEVLGSDENVTEKSKKLMFNDGFSITVISRDTKKTNSDASIGVGKKLIFTTLTDLVFTNTDSTKDLDLKKYITLGKRQFQSPIMLDSQQEDMTDRVGLYQFPVVPLQYGKMNKKLSLLRVEASKLGFYKSPAVNVKAFTVDDTSTGNIREDVVRVDLKVKPKPTYDVVVNVRDKDTNETINAIISIDGVKTDEDKTEFDSQETQYGSSASFSEIIGGKGAKRVIRVKVEDETLGYVPVIKTITLRKDKVVDIQLRSSDVIPDYKAKINIHSVNLNSEKGIVKIDAEIFDKAEDTLTDVAEVYTYLNGKLLANPILEHDASSIEFIYSIPLEIGENEIYFEVANLKGISTSSTLNMSYDPYIGTVKGTISGIESSDELMIDVYTADDTYVTTVLLDSSSNQYVINDLQAEREFKIQVVQINSDEEVTKLSDLTTVKIPMAQSLTQNLALENVETTQGFEGGTPNFDLIGDLNQSSISSDGQITLNATLMSFDKDSDGSAIYLVNNDELIQLDKEELSETTTAFSYTLNNVSVQLEQGTNVVYLLAINPDFSFDYSKDIELDWNPSANELHTLAFTVNVPQSDNSLTPLEYSNIDLYLGNEYLGTKETNENGIVEFSNLLDGNYSIQVNGGNNYEDIMKFYQISTNLNVDINMSEFTDEIELEPFSIESLNLPYEAYLNDEVNVSAEVNMFDYEDNISNYKFNWTITINNANTTETTQTVSIPTNIAGEILVKVTVTKIGSTLEFTEESSFWVLDGAVYEDDYSDETPAFNSNESENNSEMEDNVSEKTSEINSANSDESEYQSEPEDNSDESELEDVDYTNSENNSTTIAVDDNVDLEQPPEVPEILDNEDSDEEATSDEDTTIETPPVTPNI